MKFKRKYHLSFSISEIGSSFKTYICVCLRDVRFIYSRYNRIRASKNKDKVKVEKCRISYLSSSPLLDTFSLVESCKVVG